MQCATASVAMEHAAETVSSPVVAAGPFAVVPSSTSLGCSEYRGMLDGECYRRRGEHGWYEYTRALNMRPVLEFRPSPYCKLTLADLDQFNSTRSAEITPETQAMTEYYRYAEGG